jgi:type I restriction enzyme R subunit
MGWRFEYPSAVNELYRQDEVEVLLLPILRQKLKDLNPGVITDDARAEAIVTRLRGIRDNAEWIKWMRNEETYKFSAEENAQPIKLVDYESLKNNDFLCTNQFWVDGGDQRIRTDVLLFVNGIPLVNIEAKTTARDWHVDWTEGARQCGRYRRDAMGTLRRTALFHRRLHSRRRNAPLDLGAQPARLETLGQGAG